MDDITVLMTGAGAPGASGIIKSLRGVDERAITIVGVDMDSSAYGFALVDEHATVPAGDDPAYIPRMAELVTEYDADVVLPLTTAELQPLANERDRIDAAVMVSEADCLSVANDKGKLYQFLADQGSAAAPAYERVDDRDSFVEAVEALGYPDEPVCFKRPVASGMRGFRVLDPSHDQLDDLLNQKPNDAVTTLESVLPVLERADPFPELVVMEYLPGPEYSVDVVACGDEVGPVIPRSRAETRAGISFEGVVEENEALIESARDICRGLGLEYNVNIQFRHDAAGDPAVIEINPRVAGTIVMGVGAGVNLPYLGVKHALGEPLPDQDVAWGTRMTRFWDELFTTPDGETYQLTDSSDRGPRIRSVQ